MPFAIYSGNGQVVGRNYPSTNKLRVLLTDGGALPIVGQTVTWALASGVGTLEPATSVTDASGIAETTYRGGPTYSVTVAERYKTSVVRASTAGEADVDFYATTINNPLAGNPYVDLMPYGSFLSPLAPSGYPTHPIVGQIGQTLVGYIQFLVAFYDSNFNITHRVPYVSAELSSVFTFAGLATASGGPVLTDANGIATMDVVLGAVEGAGAAFLTLGLSGNGYSGQYTWRMDILARSMALPQIEVCQYVSFGVAGTVLKYTDALRIDHPAIQVRVRDAAGTPSAGIPVLWESVTPGVMDFIPAQTTLITDANGFAETYIQLSMSLGRFFVRITALGQVLLMEVLIIAYESGLPPDPAPGTVPPRPPPSGGGGVAGGGGSGIVRSGGTDRSTGKRASIAIPEITTEDLKPEALVFKLNQVLRLLATQVANVQGNNGPFAFGEGALTLKGDTTANGAVTVQKTLRLQGESDRSGNVSPIEFLNDLPTYADNATAILYGLSKGKIYKTTTGQLGVVF